MIRLDKEFFNSDPVTVANNLLGKKIISGDRSAIITEVESYGGADDPASHAFKKTPRSKLMYDEPGLVYIYLIYGMHYCLNFVVSPKGIAGAVLIRAVHTDSHVINGPGRVAKYFNLDSSYNGCDISKSSILAVYDIDYKVNVFSTPRIGISKAKDKKWRFACK